MKLSLTILAASLAALVQASNVAELTPANFDSVIAGKPALVELYVTALYHEFTCALSFFGYVALLLGGTFCQATI
jgi:hypothetical protein